MSVVYLNYEIISTISELFINYYNHCSATEYVAHIQLSLSRQQIVIAYSSLLSTTTATDCCCRYYCYLVVLLLSYY